MKKLLVLFIVSFLLILSCEKETSEINPDFYLIQGKWKMIMIGNGDNLNPYETNSYIEYYNDSLYREYNYETEEYDMYGGYTIDSLLTVSCFYTKDTITFIHEYSFFENDYKLRLVDYSLVANFSTYIFERVE